MHLYVITHSTPSYMPSRPTKTFFFTNGCHFLRFCFSFYGNKYTQDGYCSFECFSRLLQTCLTFNAFGYVQIFGKTFFTLFLAHRKFIVSSTVSVLTSVCWRIAWTTLRYHRMSLKITVASRPSHRLCGGLSFMFYKQSVCNKIFFTDHFCRRSTWDWLASAWDCLTVLK